MPKRYLYTGFDVSWGPADVGSNVRIPAGFPFDNPLDPESVEIPDQTYVGALPGDSGEYTPARTIQDPFSDYYVGGGGSTVDVPYTPPVIGGWKDPRAVGTYEPKCETTVNPSTGKPRNLLIWPPTACIRDTRSRDKVVAFYSKLKEYCFNKLFIPGLNRGMLEAAIQAGWDIEDIVVGPQCCQYCEASIELDDCPNLAFGERSGTTGEYDRNDPRNEDLRGFLSYAKLLNSQYNNSKYPTPDSVPGFYTYYVDEPYKDRKEHHVGHPTCGLKCYDNNGRRDDQNGTFCFNWCDTEDVQNFILTAREIDEELNGGVRTPVVLGDYWLGTVSPIPATWMGGESFNSFGPNQDPEADGFALTSYTQNRRGAAIDHLMGSIISNLESSRVQEVSIQWLNMKKDFVFLKTRNVLSPISKYSYFFEGAKEKGWNTMGLYALDFMDSDGIQVHDTSGREIATVNPCEEGKPTRRDHPEDDYNDCVCRLFFSFVEDFLSAAYHNGWIVQNGWFKQTFPHG